MKKIIYCLVIVFFISISIFMFKEKEDEKEEEFTYNFNFPFFKEELKEEYLNYKEKTGLPLKQSIINVNIGLNYPFYTNTKETKNIDQITMLVNKYNYLPRDYIPSNLVTINKYAKSRIMLKEEAYKAFLKLAKDMEKDNLSIRIISAYRSFDYQENLYNNYLKTATKSIVDTYSARPGYSEHQTGLVIDVDNNKLDYNNFHLTKEFIWMQENAYKYGFILRYPKDKENITGYKYEPWHYRYVGKEIAEYIQKHSITYEEYYHEFIDI